MPRSSSAARRAFQLGIVVQLANASRREMIAGGMDENKVLRVVGLSSTVFSTRTIR